MVRDASARGGQQLEEEYIDMDLTSATFLCYTITSPPHSREFEFHMNRNQLEKEPITSPADELFYKGKLLPLHLPPRLEMVEKLLNNPASNKYEAETYSFRDIPAFTDFTGHKTTSTTPYESCNISPLTSCYVSGELNPEEYFECSGGAIQSLPKKSWSKKLKQIKHCALGLKLKASKAYLKSLFTKPSRPDKSIFVAKVKDKCNGNMKAAKKNLFGQIRRGRYFYDQEVKIEQDCIHRRSFSGVINHSQAAIHSVLSSSSSLCSSSSSSFSSTSSNQRGVLPALKRSSSVNSEVENSIQGAIAYCKNSARLASARKSASDVGHNSLSAAMVVASFEKKGDHVFAVDKKKCQDESL